MCSATYQIPVVSFVATYSVRRFQLDHHLLSCSAVKVQSKKPTEQELMSTKSRNTDACRANPTSLASHRTCILHHVIKNPAQGAVSCNQSIEVGRFGICSIFVIRSEKVLFVFREQRGSLFSNLSLTKNFNFGSFLDIESCFNRALLTQGC